MKRFKLSLKEKAFIGIIATLIPILITFILVYRQNRVYLTNRTLDTLTIIAEAYEGQVYQFLEMAKRRTQDFSSDGFIRTQLEKILHGNTSAMSKLNKHLVRNKLSLDKTINTINILSLEGRVAASTNNAEIGRDFSSEAIFLNGKETVTIIEKCFGHCELTEIAISAPILNKDTGRLIGVIVTYIPIAELDNIVTGKYAHDLGAVSWTKGKGRWKTLEIYLVNRDKLMITKSIFVKDAVWKQAVDTLPINEGLTSNKEITGFYRDYRGVEVAGASMYIPSMKWVLLVEIDKSEVLSPIRRILISSLITAAVVIVMIVLLFIGFMKRMVKPLHKISDAAKNIAGGNFDVSIPVQTSDEIGALCESFNYMTRHIKTRTTALVRSEARLAESQQIAHLGSWEWDIVKNKTYESDEFYRIYGLVREEFGATYEAFLNCVHPDDRELVRKSVENALQNKKPYDIEFRILRKDETVRIVHEKAVVTFDNTGRAIRMVGTAQDITERKRAEEEVVLLKTLTLSIKESKDLHDALVITLEKVCSATEWVYGEAWTPDPEGKCLVIDHAFFSRIDTLEKFSELSGKYTFPPGIGLPGRVWSTKKPVWVQDVTLDPNYPRAAIAREAGLKAGVAFPVFSDNEIVAVLVFYMLNAHEKNERLVSFVSSALVQLVEVVKRKKAEEVVMERSRLAALGADVGFALIQKSTLREILQLCADALVLNLNVAFARIWTLNKEENVLELQSSAGIYTHIDGPHSRVPVGMYKIGLIAEERKPHLTNKVIGDPIIHDQEWARETGMVAFAGYPLTIEDRLVGVIAMFACQPLTEFTQKALASVSDVIALGIERKQVEKALRESEERLRSLLDNTTAIVYMKDTSGRYTFINRQLEKQFNITSEEILGMTDSEIWPPEMADVYQANDRKVMEAKNPLEFEEVAKQDDGLHTYISVKFPLCDSARNVYAVCGILTDITERKQMEEQLIILSYAIEQSPTSILITDTNGNIQYVNPKFTRLTGYSLEEAIGKNPRILKSGKTPPAIYKQLWDTITKGGEWQGEFCNKKKNGELYWEIVHISSIKDHAGRITHFIGFKDNITERKQMEEVERKLRDQLYHMQKLESVGTLAGGIAHDFNNILTAIIGYGNLLQKDMKEGGPSRDYVQKILKSAERAADLTQGLLAFSRKQISNPRPVYLNEIIKEVESLLVRVLREDIKLTTTLTDKECVVMADVGQMEQVLMNLATNARDAMPRGGFMNISTD